MSVHPLHRAALDGDVVSLRRELAAGVDPDTPYVYYPRTALTMLCLDGGQGSSHAPRETRLPCIQALLDAGASMLPNPLDTRAPTAPLIYATARCDPLIVNALLKAGADPNHGNADGWTALMAAVCQGNAPCAILLIKAGANLEAVYHSTNHTPLLFATRNSPRTVPILLRAGARLDMTQIAAIPGGAPPYIAKVDTAGGWKKYEQAHRKRLTTTFAKAFPRLPVDAISHMVMFAFHVGFY